MKNGEDLTEIPKILLTIAEVCSATGMSRSKVYDLISRKKLRVVKVGEGRSGGVRVRPRDIESFAERHLL